MRRRHLRQPALDNYLITLPGGNAAVGRCVFTALNCGGISDKRQRSACLWEDVDGRRGIALLLAKDEGGGKPHAPATPLRAGAGLLRDWGGRLKKHT